MVVLEVPAVILHAHSMLKAIDTFLPSEVYAGVKNHYCMNVFIILDIVNIVYYV